MIIKKDLNIVVASTFDVKIMPSFLYFYIPDYYIAKEQNLKEVLKFKTSKYYCLFNASTGGRLEAFIAGYTPNNNPDDIATNTAILIESKLTTADRPYFETMETAHEPRIIPTTQPIILT
jgi:hypothetical protein